MILTLPSIANPFLAWEGEVLSLQKAQQPWAGPCSAFELRDGVCSQQDFTLKMLQDAAEHRLSLHHTFPMQLPSLQHHATAQTQLQHYGKFPFMTHKAFR